MNVECGCGRNKRCSEFTATLSGVSVSGAQAQRASIRWGQLHQRPRNILNVLNEIVLASLTYLWTWRIFNNFQMGWLQKEQSLGYWALVVQVLGCTNMRAINVIYIDFWICSPVRWIELHRVGYCHVRSEYFNAQWQWTQLQMNMCNRIPRICGMCGKRYLWQSWHTRLSLLTLSSAVCVYVAGMCSLIFHFHRPLRTHRTHSEYI